MIPDNITRQHLTKAIEEIEEIGIRKGRHSSTYDLNYNGKKYPPKLVISIANRFANGSELDPSEFAGGKDTQAFEILKKEGFKIIPKTDPIISMIEDYKKHIIKTRLKGEIYKWELIEEYGGRPNTDAIDFYKEIKEVKFQNLIYTMGIVVINNLTKTKPEQIRQIFVNLYDESKDLTARVKSFNQDTLKIYRSLGETLQHHQDERSIATYLTFHYPNKYTFYKSSFYVKYCKLIGIEKAKKNEKYTHYLKLIDELVEKYILQDAELISLVKSIIPQFYDGSQNKLLAQDILYQMLDKKKDNNYWIFQGNPKIFDFETALRDEILNDWTVSSHKDKISIGDKVILWITGNNPGCYALAEVTAKPHKKSTSTDDHLWKTEVSTDLKANIKITHNLVETPILKVSLDTIPELKKLKVGNQGTNFSATKKEYEAVLNLIKSNNKLENPNSKKTMSYPLNTIFYGPPGSGKTRQTIMRAAQIINNGPVDSYDSALNIFKSNLHNRIEFITFHQNYSYEDFIQGLRPETNNSSSLLFEKKDGVFKRIADRAKKDPYFIPIGTKLKDYTVLKSNKDIVELWSDKTESIRYVPYQLIKDLIDGINSKKITINDIKRRRDINLPKLLGSKVEKYYFGIEGTLFNICEFLLDSDNISFSQNYVIIIDEINRANISRVFGELITLIEPDKRTEGAIPIDARLPSGDSFSVPSNLYIIGTMNTADKSIALLDIALRRRFEFESMYPLYEIEGQKIYDVEILRNINEQIIKTKGHDFQIGHAYFMGDNTDLIERMNKKIIPLLLEYFMNDEKEVKGILQSANLKIEEDSWPLKISGIND